MCFLFHLFIILSVGFFTSCQTLPSVFLPSCFNRQFLYDFLLFFSLLNQPITFLLTSSILSSSIYLFNVLYLHCFGGFHSSFLFAISVFCFLSFPPPPYCDPGCFSFLFFLLQFVFSFFTDVVLCWADWNSCHHTSRVFFFILFHPPMFVKMLYI